MNASTSGNTRLIVAIVIVVSVPLGVYLVTRRPPEKEPVVSPTQNEPTKPEPRPEPFPELTALAAAARKLQREEDRQDAQEKWEELLKQVDQTTGTLDVSPLPAELVSFRDEAVRNIDLLKQQQPPKPVNVWETSDKVTPDEKLAAKIGHRYKEGRTIQSVAVCQIKGSGTNENWFRTDVNFLYEYRTLTTTEVKENLGTRILFTQKFEQMVQLRAVADRTVKFRQLTPLNQLVFEQVEKHVLDRVPGYRMMRSFGQLWTEIVDPEAKRTLTMAADMLEKAGVMEKKWDKIDLAEQVEKLQGSEIEVEYWVGFGVTKIEMKKGPKDAFSQDDMTRIAFGSSLLMDYYVLPAADKKIGETWEVEGKHMNAMFNLYDVTVDGNLQVRRVKDKTVGGRQLIELDVVGGELTVTDDQRRGVQRATLRPRAGNVLYSPEGHFVQSATLDWDSTTTWFSKGHLLFGTKDTRDLQCRTLYEARDLTTRADTGEAP